MAEHTAPRTKVDAHLTDAHNGCADALDHLFILDMAIADLRSEHRFVSATLTVLERVTAIIEAVHDDIDSAKREAAHG